MFLASLYVCVGSYSHSSAIKSSPFSCFLTISQSCSPDFFGSVMSTTGQKDSASSPSYSAFFHSLTSSVVMYGSYFTPLEALALTTIISGSMSMTAKRSYFRDSNRGNTTSYSVP